MEIASTATSYFLPNMLMSGVYSSQYRRFDLKKKSLVFLATAVEVFVIRLSLSVLHVRLLNEEQQVG